jgi:signal transduction histidine kinase
VKKWLQLARFDELVNLDEIDVSELSGDEEAKLATAAMKPVHWTSRSALRVFNFLIGLPEGRIRRDFIIAEELKQRYQMIQATWEDQIRPTFVKANILIMFVTFALLVASLFVMARGLRRRMSQLLDGFRIWSERDSHYRFDKAAWSGELRAVAVQFNRMADEVDANRQRSLYLEKMASWQVIARKLAHEIKNPLTPIQMMVSQLSRHYKGDDPEFKKILDEAQTIITEEVAGLRRMVDHFSRFARLPEARFGRHDLKTLCQHAIELEKATFPQHEFRFECALGQVMATIDDHLMRQVLINLLKNAAEAIGAARGVITVRVLANFSDYLIEIEDNGSGVPADIKERVFEAYFTTKHTGPSPGMGLGLAVCQKVVMDHGGEIAVVSEPGRTVFTVRLPIKFEGGIHESSGT